MLSLLLTTVLAPIHRPSLVVILSIDQGRSDYITRFEKQYLPAEKNGRVGGFNYLTQNGAWYLNARYRHVPTATGPGHSVIGTGSIPALTGIIANEWYDHATNKMVYCVDDPDAKDIFSGAASMSPKNEMVSTIGDELKLATAGRSKVVSIALKDRAAILMAGHAADSAVWFSRGQGGWTTSDYFAPDRKLPAWAQSINDQKIPDKMRGKEWNLLQGAASYQNSFPSANPNVPPGFRATFPHLIADDKSFYDAWTTTPFSNDFVVDTALSAVDNLQLGNHDVPDLVTLNFSSFDYVGHRFGPYSPEMADMSLRTDVAISNLLNGLNAKVKGGLANVLFVLTADHGVLPVVEDMQGMRIPAQRMPTFEKDLATKVKAKINCEPIANVDDGMLWLDYRVLEKAGVSLATAQRAVVDVLQAMPETYRAYTAQDLITLPGGDDITNSLKANGGTSRGADVYFVLRPANYQDGGKGTSHGTPWIFDASVPLIFCGPAVSGGRYLDRSGPEDIAATICAALGIIPPNGSVGRALGISQR